MIAPIIDELQAEYKDKLKCVKLNTDESPQVATDYGIRSIPTVRHRGSGRCRSRWLAGCSQLLPSDTERPFRLLPPWLKRSFFPRLRS